MFFAWKNSASLTWLESLANRPPHATTLAAGAGLRAGFGAAGAAAGAGLSAALSSGLPERGPGFGLGFTAGTVCTWRGAICSSGVRFGCACAKAAAAPSRAVRLAIRRVRTAPIVRAVMRVPGFDNGASWVRHWGDIWGHHDGGRDRPHRHRDQSGKMRILERIRRPHAGGHGRAGRATGTRVRASWGD